MLHQLTNLNQQIVDDWQQCLKLAQMMCDFAEKQIEDGEIIESRLTLANNIEKVKKEKFGNCPNDIEQQRVQIEKRFHQKLSEVIEICKRRSNNRQNLKSQQKKSNSNSSSESDENV